MTSELLARGARVLPELALPKVEATVQRAVAVLSLYRARFAELEELETQAQEAPEWGRRWRDSVVQDRHFHPVITVLGARGSGKSSLLLTILHRLEREFPGDLVLAPLDSHRLLKGDRMLFWLLAALKPVVDYVSERQRKQRAWQGGKHNFERGESNFDDDAHADGGLAGCYQEVVDTARQMFKPESVEHSGMNGLLRQHHLAAGMGFPEKFRNFVRQLTDAHAQCASANSKVLMGRRNTAERPAKPSLLVVPIDDVDLVPEFFDELLTLVRLLSPKVSRLVLVITADEVLAHECRREHYLHSLYGKTLLAAPDLPGLWRPQEVNDDVFELTRQFFEKFLPEEGRVLVAKIGTEDIFNFRLYNTSLVAIGAHQPDADKATRELPTFQDLLDKLGFWRYLDLGWVYNGNIVVHSAYMDLLPANPRLLEEAYLILKEAVEGLTEPRMERNSSEMVKARTRVCQRLGRLLSGTHPKWWRYFNFEVSKASLPRLARVTCSLDIQFHQQHSNTSRLGNYFSELGQAGSPSETPLGKLREWQFNAWHGHQMGLRVPGGMAPAGEQHMPPSAIQTYLFLQEFLDPALGDFQLAAPLPGLQLTQAPVVCWGSRLPAASTEQNSAGYVLAVEVADAEGGGASILALSLAPWPRPIQWQIFFAHWNQVMSSPEMRSSAGRVRYVLAQLIQAVIAVSGLESLLVISLRPAERKPLLNLGLSELAHLTDELREAYLQDVRSASLENASDDAFHGVVPAQALGAGALATWVEQGLYRFLLLLEERGCPKALSDALGLSAKQIWEQVLDPAVVQLAKDRVKGQYAHQLRTLGDDDAKSLQDLIKAESERLLSSWRLNLRASLDNPRESSYLRSLVNSEWELRGASAQVGQLGS